MKGDNCVYNARETWSSITYPGHCVCAAGAQDSGREVGRDKLER